MAGLVFVFSPDAVSASWPCAFVGEGRFLGLRMVQRSRVELRLCRLSNSRVFSCSFGLFLFSGGCSMERSASFLLGCWQGPEGLVPLVFQDSVTEHPWKCRHEAQDVEGRVRRGPYPNGFE